MDYTGNGIRNGESYGIDINNVTACIRKPFSSQFCCQNKNSPNLGRCYGSVSDCQSNCPNDLDPHTCEKAPLVPPSSCFWLSGLLCGLVPDCGSVIARFDGSESKRFQIALTLTIWSHPTLAGIKLVILLLLTANYPLVHGNGIRNGESYGIDINNVTACIRKPFSSQFCCQNKNSPNLGRCYGSVSECQSNCPNVLDPHV
uniref:Uncharacterized protein n=1 Tax=Oryza rufipogon TaxID=4529 RepID=A0A0E0QP21_ORYRU